MALLTKSGAIMGKRSVRLSRSARLLPIPSSSFSDGVTDEQVTVVGCKTPFPLPLTGSSGCIEFEDELLKLEEPFI